MPREDDGQDLPVVVEDLDEVLADDRGRGEHPVDDRVADGREGPLRGVVDDDVLWTSRCPDGRNPYPLELSVDADGDALLRNEGSPAFQH